MYETNKDFVRREQKGGQIASELDRERNGGAHEAGKRPGLQAIARHRSQQGQFDVRARSSEKGQEYMRGTISKTPQGISGCVVKQ